MYAVRLLVTLVEWGVVTVGRGTTWGGASKEGGGVLVLCLGADYTEFSI